MVGLSLPGTGSWWECHSQARGHGGAVTPRHGVMVGVSVWAWEIGNVSCGLGIVLSCF